MIRKRSLGAILLQLQRKEKPMAKAKKSGPKPTNPALYARMKAKAKRKFSVFPSAYASAYIVREYKKAGGKYSGKKPS
ncbi:MAG: hypothetical protein CMC82_09875 [Flavobacteriaceae bacterium]|nr:hypothetical protein [Flavobacteriaceae bacterium]